MQPIDLTPFGFTPTEGHVYQVLLTVGPGTGYGIARSAGLARANAYAALEGLVQKGAARAEDGRPKRYRPEPPDVLLARIVDRQGAALQQLEASFADVVVPNSPTLVEIASPRGAFQLIARDIARATRTVMLCVPGDAFPLLTPALRKANGSGVALTLLSDGPVALDFVSVSAISPGTRWPGTPVVAVIDGRSAVVASRRDDTVTGYWGTSAPHVAAAHLSLERLAEAVLA